MKLLGAALLLTTMALQLNAGPRDAQWKAVQDAINKGLPQTAISNLEPIITATLKEKANPELVKAIGKKIVLEGLIQGNRPEERITRLKAQIEKAPPETAPILSTILAYWYWDYFNQNRGRFMQRTAGGAKPGSDFRTWDLPALFAEIDRQFQNALKAEASLKSTPVQAWDELLERGTMPDVYRPTLYDFIAHEALAFYESGEQAAARPEEDFVLTADSPALADSQAFLDWKPPFAPDAEQRSVPTALRAVSIYQNLLRFHKDDPAPKLAFAEADLGRLKWAWNTVLGEEKTTRYKDTLERFSRDYADFEISALADERRAQILQTEGDLVGARATALRGAQAFADSPGGKLCRNLVLTIESKSVSIQTERVWNAPWPEISVQYRNLDKVYFKVIPFDWGALLDTKTRYPETMDQPARKALLSKQPALEWSSPLPATADYKERTERLSPPQALKPGYYYLIASHDPAFGEEQNVISIAMICVSDLALVKRTRGSAIEGFVTEALSGEPLDQAEVAVWRIDDRGNTRPEQSLKTDRDGFFALKSSNGRRFLFRIRHADRELGTFYETGLYSPTEQPNDPVFQTMFFTDRALYRPGQIIQYKGLCLRVDQKHDNYELLKGEELTVALMDGNGKLVSRQKRRANDYGSFSGSFIAPRDRLLGSMSLQVEGRAQGAAAILVEEYKRPKFEVTLAAPETGAKLNEQVSLTGEAQAYTGAAVDGAEVKYRVMRTVERPWWWWSPGWRESGDQEIAHGTIQTDKDGSFKFSFVAKPDLSYAETNDPTFVFRINADVTDSSGETRSSSKDIRVAYRALEVKLSSNDWQTTNTPVEIVLKAESLDSVPQVAEGMVRLYELEQPARVARAPLVQGFRPVQRPGKEPSSPERPETWPLGRNVAEKGFTTDTNGSAKLTFPLSAGIYRAVLESQDRYGKKVTGNMLVKVVDPSAPKLGIRVPQLVVAPKWELEPGQDFVCLWGTGYETGRACIEVEHRGQIIKRLWTDPSRTQQEFQLPVTEAMRGGFTLHITQVRENRAYLKSEHVEVPWSNKELEIHWEHFVSKLQPGQKESWTCVIKPKLNDADSAQLMAAEMVAALYDESLDAFAGHNWLKRLDIFRRDYSSAQPSFENTAAQLAQFLGKGWQVRYQPAPVTYRAFPQDLVSRGMRLMRNSGRAYFGLGGGDAIRTRMSLGDAQPMSAAPGALARTESLAAASANMDAFGAAEPAKLALADRTVPAPAPAQIPLGSVSARKNLQETAFFYPQLLSDSNGVVRLSFVMPEALTRWHFLGFAHDKRMRSGSLEDHAVTAKDLMVQPNPPRFVREGDAVEFTVKVSNQSDKKQNGTVRLNFREANEQPADKLLGISRPELEFDIPPKESRSYSWRIAVPDRCGFLFYKAVAASATVSDGEEGAVPVLARRILVTESLPLSVRGPGNKTFEFANLVKSSGSKSLVNQNLTVQVASNPAWYAVLALPYLMEYPYECSEQIFNRFYANALARHIANSNPRIRTIFDQWKNTRALDSPLEKNQDLKSVMLEETPWLRNGQDESQARRNVGILFDDNRLQYEQDSTLRKLMEMQSQDGSWSWFPGGQANHYISLYIVTGFGRLRHLGMDVDANPAVRALQFLDEGMLKQFNEIQKLPSPEDYTPSATDALYLYGRSFFLKDAPVAARHKPAVDFFLKQARKLWLQTSSRQSQGHIALALTRFGKTSGVADPVPADIMKSLKERSVSSEEMGMFWRDTELAWWWYHAPIETQALMIEAFDEVAGDQTSVENCKVWLLKQKQTTDWKTTKATADAVYSLLLRGTDLLSSDALVALKLDNTDFTPVVKGQAKANSNDNRKAFTSKQVPVEPGTGFYEIRFAGPEIKPALGKVTLTKQDKGVAWGSIHWQYLEDIEKVKVHEATPLTLKKSLFLKTTTAQGQILEPVNGALKPGDELVVRIELRSDRDMEYVHMKDQRGSGTEPVNVLSQYKYQDGLGYYESTRDTASHFFIDYLRKGTYVFEYSSRVQLRGEYQTGIAEIQCMYAPEFNSHSASIKLTVN